MRMIVIGGPGRSGTTYVANRIGTHLQCAHFFDIELKILSEIDGLSDLRHSLCEHYSPPRASIMAGRFRDCIIQLANGTYGQPKLAGETIDTMMSIAVENFLSKFRKGGEFFWVSHATFNRAARVFFEDLYNIASVGKPEAEFFVEKTPHNSLNMKFISELFPEMDFIHISRDPRAIALSLLQQIWGPNTLEDAVGWISNYLEAWERNRDIALRYGVRMKEIRIEDLVSAPLTHSNEIQDFLGLNKNENIFFDASSDSINGWLQFLTPDKTSFLNEHLGSWVTAMGYNIDPASNKNLNRE